MTEPEDDDWTPLDDLVALHTADDVAELHRRLVLYPTAATSASDAFEPWCLFQQFHKDNPEGAVATVVLLLTDRRWRNATVASSARSTSPASSLVTTSTSWPRR